MKTKRGQVTIFIIIAIVIVVSAVFIFVAYPRIKSSYEAAKSPQQFIQTCVEDDLKGAVEKVSLRGGDAEPDEGFFTYEGNKVKYLCYMNENYLECKNQQPMLVSHIESEIEEEISDEVETCFESLKTNYHKKDYVVNIKNNGINVELVPEKIIFNLNYSVSLTKDGTENYDSFVIDFDNDLYGLVRIAEEIIDDSEIIYGDAAPTTSMMMYSYLESIETPIDNDVARVYVLTNKDGVQFVFAVRSGIVPAGGY